MMHCVTLRDHSLAIHTPWLWKKANSTRNSTLAIEQIQLCLIIHPSQCRVVLVPSHGHQKRPDAESQRPVCSVGAGKRPVKQNKANVPEQEQVMERAIYCMSS